jgi:diaminopimelate decarboxylase
VLYGAGYEAYLPGRVADARPLACSIVGKHCEQGDIIVADARLPAGVAVGDLLAMPATGAYGYSMASNYNKVPRPAVVFVRDGTPRVVVRRETFEDLVRLDAE